MGAVQRVARGHELQAFHGTLEMFPADVGEVIGRDIDRADLMDLGLGGNAGACQKGSAQNGYRGL